jgi:hypothetical protein
MKPGETTKSWAERRKADLLNRLQMMESGKLQIHEDNGDGEGLHDTAGHCCVNQAEGASSPFPF